MKKKILILMAIISITAIAGGLVGILALPNETSNNFAGSGNCVACHESAPGVFEDAAGNNISPVNLWMGSMMANSSKDPYWQAKVSAEVDEYPELAAIIEDKCNTCHTPMGRTEAIFNGEDGYSFADAMNDPLSMDGVSCTACHQIQPDNFGTPESFSGEYEIKQLKELYGPYQNPNTGPMAAFTGFTPVYSEHVQQSELCATCHTLYTPFIDNEGAIAGYFPEQTPYLEWKNSDFHTDNTSCQDCHMVTHEVSTKISSRPGFIGPRTPIYGHEFLGANVFMTKILQNNKDLTNAQFTDTQFNEKLVAHEEFMNSAIDLKIDATDNMGEILIELEVINNAGHKFPTGFPSREAWINLQVLDKGDNLVFESGKLLEDGSIQGEDSDYEPHHDVIESENQVQIYQAIMKDVDDKVTFTLLRGSSYIKDNRIPPKGFKKDHTDYTDAAIVGEADKDPNFNKVSSDASGSDLIRYNIPVENSLDNYKIIAKLYYRTISKKFADELFNHSTEKVNSFKAMYDKEDQKAVLVKSIEKDFTNTSIFDSENQGVLIYPNPFNNQFKIELPGNDYFNNIEIYDLTGNLIYKSSIYNQEEITVEPFKMFSGISSGVLVIRLIGLKTEYTKNIVFSR